MLRSGSGRCRCCLGVAFTGLRLLRRRRLGGFALPARPPTGCVSPVPPTHSGFPSAHWWGDQMLWGGEAPPLAGREMGIVGSYSEPRLRELLRPTRATCVYELMASEPRNIVGYEQSKPLSSCWIMRAEAQMFWQGGTGHRRPVLCTG